ncbi:hypothetical protein H5410_024287 [Solanum commersonii]|uniref:Uncharacterized protein n=1 Tax=Solanum commersonii TaxID=4109 RepID=A0A9J5ZLL7_SOLCO|nr:hypothetical protein H5410_024287 [Solanum commersonii]
MECVSVRFGREAFPEIPKFRCWCQSRAWEAGCHHDLKRFVGATLVMPCWHRSGFLFLPWHHSSVFLKVFASFLKGMKNDEKQGVTASWVKPCTSKKCMPLNFLGLGVGGGCGIGVGLGWGFGSAFGSQYRNSRVTFDGTDFINKGHSEERDSKDLAKGTRKAHSSQ